MNNEKVNNPLKESKNKPIREKYANKSIHAARFNQALNISLFRGQNK
jgi:hypothetical protein